MSKANQVTMRKIKWRANRRTFLSYLGSAPMVTAFAGTGLLSTEEFHDHDRIPRQRRSVHAQSGRGGRPGNQCQQHPLPRWRGAGFPRQRMFWNAIVTSDRQPKHRNPAQLRSRGLDQVRPADCVEGPARLRYFRTTRRRTPLRPPAGIREAIRRT